MNKYVQIIVDSRTQPMEGEYTYLYKPEASEPILEIGHLVRVPLGRKIVRGIVVKIHDSKPAFPVKPIGKILFPQPVVKTPQIKLARFIAKYYYCSLGQALFTMIPAFLFKNQKNINLAGKTATQIFPLAIDKNTTLSKLQAKAYEYINTHPGLTATELMTQANISRSVINTLHKKNAINMETVRILRKPAFDHTTDSLQPLLLPGQQKIIDHIDGLTHSSEKKPVLIFGRTGSGKTEIYLRSAENALKQGRGVIILVPEISLLPQTLARFYERFGSLLAVFHSRLSEGEKYDEWSRLISGEARVVIGSRSALFAPVQDLGLIIIDEEHEFSYKQDMTPRYHAVDVAEKYASLTDSILILGSATPRLETFWWAKKKRYDLFRLTKTAGETVNIKLKRAPGFHIADLRQEYLAKNYSLLSYPLQLAIQIALNQKKQILLFLNRRGNASYVFCRECGYVATCPNCSVPMTHHLTINDGRLVCHHCGTVERPPVSCPKCKSKAIKYYGAGTQKLEQETRLMFPTARILRMDHDTTTTKNAHEKLFSSFKKHEFDILIGTQMIAKGWDLPNVDLIGIINADAGFSLPDFRATERNFALLLQLMGRVGRGTSAGQIILQTYQPENPLHQILQKEDYQVFAFSELIERQKGHFPPFANVVRLVYESADPKECQIKSLALFKKLNELFQKHREDILEVLGPSPAFFERLHNKYRWHILLKGYDLQKYLPIVPPNWTIDIDPYSIL